ncbi:hypothetical protein VL15_38295 [Burkholderia cepacia]|uniref:Uncharacterized protein n=1 Tax=Burkholderia cepacia TaxID=292 RepID=A0A0J5VSM9_BURCE|nr:type III secretion system translocator chaperone SicA [Burkholderia cepacia]KML40114.1 hypothetical protein VL15_38295 [Burkholderia cepacia]
MSENVSKENVAARVLDAVMKGALLKDIHGVPDDVMEGIYAFAFDSYNKGQLQQAEEFFRFLCLYDFRNADYMMGLAAVFQLQQRYQQAADLYTVTYALSKNDFRPVFHAGQCHLSLGKVGKARQYFEMVAMQCRDQSLRDQAQAYLDALADAKTSKIEAVEDDN